MDGKYDFDAPQFLDLRERETEADVDFFSEYFECLLKGLGGLSDDAVFTCRLKPVCFRFILFIASNFRSENGRS